MLPLTPKQSGEYVLACAKHVSLHNDGVHKLAKKVLDALRNKKLCVNNFSQHELHPQIADDKAIAWIFVVDALNFSFWTSPTSNRKWEVSYKGKSYTGYFALCAAINRAIDECIPILDPIYFSRIDRKAVEQIFRSDRDDCEIPLIDERVAVLHEVGKVLLEKYKGTFSTCLQQSKNSAQVLLNTIVSNFPCFNDSAVYDNTRVSLHKRAQILIGDIWACFQGKDLGMFTDINTITMFADYRVPQVLVHFGVMTYKPDLMLKLKSNMLLPNGSEEEVEIRACSIAAVELVTALIEEMKSVNENNLEINAILVDHFLWDYRRRHALELDYIPFHLTRCIYY